MKYSTFPGTDVTVSRLGYGCMRLPTLDSENHPIDRKEAIRLIRHAIDNGVTYIDTAYPYHGGDSEVLVGEALKDGYREKVTLTTKLPLWAVNESADMEKLLDEQLRRLQLDHVDFYLAHAVNNERFEAVTKLGLFGFMNSMKQKGKIRYAGFSFHDNAEVFKKVVDSYPWRLAQVQMNILDENNQATMKGIEYAASKGIGVVIMEPLRGGALVNKVPAEVQRLYDAMPTKRSAAGWAFRYLYDRPEIVTILSGMSAFDQLAENLEIFREAEPNCANEDEKRLFRAVRKAYEARVRVGCTGCAYCQPCPKGVKIPDIFAAYDTAAVFDDYSHFYERYRRWWQDAKCVKCGACEKACPQHLKIRDWLSRISSEVSENA